MTKYGRPGLYNSSSGSDGDSENGEQLKESIRAEMEDQVAKILKLIKNNDQDGKEWNREESLKKESELVTLIEDIHKQYKSLHALYDQLKEELTEKVHYRKGKEVYPFSPSSSESEYYSPMEVSGKNNKWNEPQKGAEGIKQALQMENLEVSDDLKRELNFATENEDSHSENKASLSKNQEFERMISDLKIEAEHRQNTIQSLQDESAELKEKLGEKEMYILSSVEMHKVRESVMSAKTKELEGPTAVLSLELNSLLAEKREMEEEIKSKTIEIKQLGEKNSGLQTQIPELEKKLERKGDQLFTVVHKFKDHTQNSKSKIDELVAQVNNLQVEVDSLRTQKSKLEEQIVFERNEASDQDKGLMEQVDKGSLLKDSDTDRLHDKILELEKTLTERGDELSALQRKFENGDEVSAQFISLTAQFNKLQKEFDSLQTEKRQMELQIAREKQESSESLIQARSLNSQLTSMIEKRERTLKEQEVTINQLSRRYELAEGWLQKPKSNLQISEKKMEESAEDFRKSMEDKIRLLSRRIRVAEALHAETKEGYRMTKERFEEEHKILEEKIGEYAEIIASTESSVKRMKDISETASNMLTGLDCTVKKFEDDTENLLYRILRIVNELRFAKNWVSGTSKASEELKGEVGNLVGQMIGNEEDGSLLREQVFKLLEEKLRKEGAEKVCLMDDVIQLKKVVEEMEKLVKEKEDGMLSLGEEKREAIRQLCVWIDYHRSRYDHLKELISKMRIKSWRASFN